MDMHSRKGNRLSEGRWLRMSTIMSKGVHLSQSGTIILITIQNKHSKVVISNRNINK